MRFRLPDNACIFLCNTSAELLNKCKLQITRTVKFEKFSRTYHHQIALKIILLLIQIEAISPTIGKLQLKAHCNSTVINMKTISLPI